MRLRCLWYTNEKVSSTVMGRNGHALRQRPAVTIIAERIKSTVIDDRTVRRDRSDAEDRVVIVVLAGETDMKIER